MRILVSQMDLFAGQNLTKHIKQILCTAMGLTLGLLAHSQIIVEEDFENGIAVRMVSNPPLLQTGGWLAGHE